MLFAYINAFADQHTLRAREFRKENTLAGFSAVA